MQRIRLIITADEYGMCASVNSAIEECMTAGTIRSTSVMANMPECEQASQLRRRFPDVSVGIHWNLTQGCPILKPDTIPSFVNNRGHFFSARELKVRWLLGKIRKTEIRKELVAQYRQLRGLVGTPDFWNTHENIHNWPITFQFFVRVGNEPGIGLMRNTLRVTAPYRKSYVIHNMTHPAQYLTNQAHYIQSSLAKWTGMRIPVGMYV